MTAIAGYTYGTDQVASSPLTDEELDQLKQALLFGDDDVRALRMSRDVLAGQVDAILDVWYGFVGSHPHLVHYFARRPDGQPSDSYLARVRERFGRWILDTAEASYDRAWLDYQHEIGLRHHRTKKNLTDAVDSVEIVPLRYLIAFIYPITATIRGFLENKGHSAADVEAMHQAWFKAVTLSVVLWSQPYAPETW